MTKMPMIQEKSRKPQERNRRYKKSKTGISERKQDSSVHGLTSRMEETKEKISELENKTIDITESEEQGENRLKK